MQSMKTTLWQIIIKVYKIECFEFKYGSVYITQIIKLDNNHIVLHPKWEKTRLTTVSTSILYVNQATLVLSRLLCYVLVKTG